MKSHGYNLLILTLLLGFTLTNEARAQLVDSSQPIEMEADSTGADARTGKVTFTNISIRQGPLSIKADHAESSTLGFDDSTWIFRGNVALNAPTSALNASRMTLRFANKQIQRAILTGAPLQYSDNLDNGTRVIAQQADLKFSRSTISTVDLTGAPIELSRAATADSSRTEGKANAISYDAASSNLRMTGDAELGEGVNRITGNQITYNLITRQVIAAGNEQGEPVRITIIPTSDDTPADTNSDTLPEDIGDNPESLESTEENVEPTGNE